MTSVTPTIQVLLDDGTGTYPTDITSRVNLSQGVSVSGHGRTDEFSEATASTFTCTLKNNDAHLSNGTIALAPGQGVRYKQTFGSTTVNRFTGRISEAPLGFTSTGKASVVTLTAVDPLSSLARRPLRSMIEQEILLDSPTAYYTLGEAQGATSAGDTSGNANPALAIAGSGAAVAFGDDTQDVTGVTDAKFTGGGQFLRSPVVGTPFISGGSSWSLELFFTAGTSGNYALVDDGNGLTVELSPASGFANLSLTLGGVFGGGASVGALLAWDGDTHQAAFTYNGTTLKLYIDGELLDSDAGTGTTSDTTQLTLAASASGTLKLNGTMSSLAVYSNAVLNATRIASHSAAVTGFSETTDARFARIASYVGMSTSTPSASGQLVGLQDTTGGSALDALQAVTTTEGGVMFANGTGTLVMQGRYYRTENTTADLTVHAKDIDVGTTVSLDDQQIVNQETVTREGGATQTWPTDLSLGTADRYPQSVDLIVAADSDALVRAQWDVAKHSTAVPRIGSAKVSLLTSSQAEQLIAAEIGDRWTLSGMPTQQWTSAGDLSLEGWSETLMVTDSSAEWSVTANLLPWALFQAAVWDDSGSKWDTAVWGY